MAIAPGFVFVIEFFCLPLLVPLVAAWGPVRRARVERFARLHDLVVTAGNGAQIISYLATTRRWRSAGVIVGALLSLAWSLAHSGLQVSFLCLFAGWFVGALVAEARIVRLSPGTRRVASLVPRRTGRYLSRAARVLLPAAGGLSLALGVATALAAATGRAVAVGPALAWLAVALSVLAVVPAMQRQVLRRSQPVAADDMLAADNAIRSRSLHLLAGSGVALVLYCTLGQLAALGLGDDGGTWAGAARGLGAVAVPLIGWAVATMRRPVATAEGGPALLLGTGGGAG